MTTRVSIDAHAGWPVEVTMIDVQPDGTKISSVVTVAPHTAQDFYVHSSRELLIKELSKQEGSPTHLERP